MLPPHSTTQCSPVGIGIRGISTHLPPLAAFGATLTMKRCFSTVFGMSVMLLSFRPRKVGSSSAITSSRFLEQFLRQLDAFARHLVRRARPQFGVRRLVA